MSTRAAYTFIDDRDTFHVYKHSDGYPAGAAIALEKALDHAWPLPRFEADDFAAAFVAANKPSCMQKAAAYERDAAAAEAAGDPERAEACRSRAEDYRSGSYASFRGGEVRLIHDFADIGDLAYRYEIRAAGHDLRVRAFEAGQPRSSDGRLRWTAVFGGTFAQFAAWAAEDDARRRA